MGSGVAALLVLPLLVSGYLFNTILYPSRYFSKRADGQRLFFMSAGSGLLLGILAFVVAGYLKQSNQVVAKSLTDLGATINVYIPVPFASRILLMLAFSIALPIALNVLMWLRYRKEGRATAKRVFDGLISTFGNPISQLLRRAADRQKLVMLTMKSRKIYCGRILEVPSDIDAVDACIELLPFFSGYRDKDTLRMGEGRTDYPVIAVWEARQYEFTLTRRIQEYRKFLQALPAKRTALRKVLEEKEIPGLEAKLAQTRNEIASLGDLPNFDAKDWIKVIPLKEIESASFYDPIAYGAWFSIGSSPVSQARIPRASWVR